MCKQEEVTKKFISFMNFLVSLTLKTAIKYSEENGGRVKVRNTVLKVPKKKAVDKFRLVTNLKIMLLANEKTAELTVSPFHSCSTIMYGRLEDLRVSRS